MTLLTTRRGVNPFLQESPAATAFEDMMNRLFSESAGARPWAPPVDISETENELTLKADIPGVKLEDINIEVENGTLSISGSRSFQSDETKGGYHRQERAYGAFNRAFVLPETVDLEKVTADCSHGVLTITLPKKELAKPRTIKIGLSK
ncbi:MAG TPA: Hsp20/alpha crystallin family protein [Bryobacteraceae bacterium]|nr:Hsp20/alpha crystallin family protein [Bryobacteraceae bacterium]